MSSNFESNKDEHSLELKSRKALNINGVQSVIAFDENEVSLITNCGEMEIDGNSLKVEVLDIDRGRVSISGEICGINYISDHPKKKKRHRGIN
jgi:sporulation protein YabP